MREASSQAEARLVLLLLPKRSLWCFTVKIPGSSLKNQLMQKTPGIDSVPARPSESLSVWGCLWTPPFPGCEVCRSIRGCAPLQGTLVMFLCTSPLRICSVLSFSTCLFCECLVIWVPPPSGGMLRGPPLFCQLWGPLSKLLCCRPVGWVWLFLHCGAQEVTHPGFPFPPLGVGTMVYPEHGWAGAVPLLSDAEMRHSPSEWGGGHTRPPGLSLGAQPPREAGQGAVSEGRVAWMRQPAGEAAEHTHRMTVACGQGLRARWRQ